MEAIKKDEGKRKKRITIDEDKCRDIARELAADPPGANAPFINVNRGRYDELQKKSPFSKDTMKKLRERMGPKEYGRMRGALDMSLGYGRTFLPAFTFFHQEFLNDEWLATVDWHKFHRDHTVHQSMTACVGMWLLDGADGDFLPGGKTLLDHFVNIFLNGKQTKYLREYLLEMGGPKLNPENNVHKLMAENIIKDTFFLAALYHDLGYPWRFVNTIHDKLDPHSPEENPAERGSKWIASRYGGRLMFYPLNGYRKPDPSSPSDWPDRFSELVGKGLTKTHGMPGAVSFLHMNDILRNYPDGRAPATRRFCVEWAAMAIMMHDMGGIYGKAAGKPPEMNLKVAHPQLRLKFSRDPMSAFLTLCDLIEDFGRPDAGFKDMKEEKVADGEKDKKDKANKKDKKKNADEKKNADKVEVKYFARVSQVDLKLTDSGTLEITHVFNRAGDLANQRAIFMPESQLLYFDPSRGYLDFSDIGISRLKFNARMKEKRIEK